MMAETVEKKATLRLNLDAHGNLRRSRLVLESGASQVLFEMRKKKHILLQGIRAKLPIRVRKKIHIAVDLADLRQAGSWKCDLEELIQGLNVQMEDQKGNIVPPPRSCFANPQYY